jgi:hypothetical protein
MAPAPNLQELIDTVRRDSPESTPLIELSTAATLIAEANEVGDATLGFFVDQARHAGHSWSQIGEALGVSKQAAQQRHQRSSAATLASFERVTARARRVIEASEFAARDLGHSYIGTEHLLLAIYNQPESIAAIILDTAGLTAPVARAAVTAIVPDGRGAPDGNLPFTPRSSQVFTKATEAALQLGHNYVGTEHLLLGLVEGDGVAARVLHDAGLTYQQTLDAVISQLAGFQATGAMPSTSARTKPDTPGNTAPEAQS